MNETNIQQLNITCNSTHTKDGQCACNASHMVGGVEWDRSCTETVDDDYYYIGNWDVVTNEFRMYFQIINFVFICQLIALFGTATNIINIIAFVKQGLKDSVNISFLGLTISDLLSLVTLVWHNISLIPLLYETNIPFDPEQTVYLTGGIPHVAFTRVTGWITAFITLERCLCITHPLKIKTFITPRRVTIIITCIYIVILGSNVIPAYYSLSFVLVQHPYLNRTWIALGPTPYRRLIEQYAFPVNSVLLPYLAFAIVVASTLVLIIKLRKKTKWRKKSICAGKSEALSSRDRSVAIMVLLISTIFIACYIPVCIIFLGMIAEPKLAIDGWFGNVFAIVFSVAYVVESINASFNIFVYYKVSSRYRMVVRNMLCIDKSDEVSKVSKKKAT